MEGPKAIDYHYCTDEELGIVPGPNTEIYPPNKETAEEFFMYKKKFKCVNREDRVIWGDY